MGRDATELLARCGRRQQGLATAGQLRRAGLPVVTLSRAVARGSVVRVRPAVYSPRALPALPRLLVTDAGADPAYVLHVRAALLSLGPRATACGRTAAALRGWALLHEPTRTVHLAVPNGRDGVALPGVRATQRRQIARERLRLAGDEPVWVTTAVQTALDCLRELPLLDGVVVLDSALRSGQLSLDELRAAVGSLPGHEHAGRARRALDLADPASGSVLESVMRVRMVQAGIRGWTTQRELRSADGRYLLRVDFCFEAARLVVEVDGARWHRDARRDQHRDNQLAAAGWRVLRFSWHEVVREPDQALRTLRAALDGCGAVQSATARARATAA